MRYEQVNLFQALQFDHARDIAEAAIEAFVDGRVDSVYLVYNEFKSVIQQRIVVERLLPIPRLDIEGPAPRRDRGADRGLSLRAGAGGAVHHAAAAPRRGAGVPSAARIERRVLRRADDGDGRGDANSADMIEQLTLYMNKVRQAAITREIIEVVSGAQAL